MSTEELLPPLASAVLALRGSRVAALPHVVAAVSACLDCGLPARWSLPRACGANLLALLPRLAARRSPDAEDPFHLAQECSAGLVSAVAHDNLAMAEWLHAHCPRVLPYSAVRKAAELGNLELLRWLDERHPHVIFLPNLTEVAAATNQLAVLQWLQTHPKNFYCCSAESVSRAFVTAAASGHLDALKWLHENYRDVVENPHVRLVEAVSNGHADVAKYLYERPVFNVDVSEGFKRAARQGDLEFIQWLAARYPEQLNNSAISGAARGGHLEVVQWIYRNLPHGYSGGAIAQAAEGGHLEVIQWLHARRGSALGDSDAMTAATSNGHLHVIKWLHENRSESCSGYGMNYAALSGHLETIQWMHEHRSERCTGFAMNFAAMNGHLNIVKWLHAMGMQFVMSWVGNVAAYARLEVLQWISEQLPDGELLPPVAFDRAVECGHLEVAKWLYSRGLSGTPRFDIGYVAANGNLELLKWLHENQIESEGEANGAIISAARGGNFDTMLYLYARDPDVGFMRGGFDNGELCLRHMETVQWLYDKEPESVGVGRLRAYASYMPAVIEHILGVPAVNLAFSIAIPSISALGLSSES